MPTVWPYIFIRDAFGDVGNIPSGARVASHSPDIVPVGPNPLPNFQQTLQQQWNNDIGVDVTAGVNNYLYMRGWNNNVANESGAFTLYFAPSSTLLTPSSWVNNVIPAANGDQSVNVVSTSPQAIALPAQAFMWPTVPTPPANQHYCLIGVFTDGTTVPDPVPTQPFTTPDAFVNWVLNNPNVAWRNVNTVLGNVNTQTMATNVANNDTTNPRQYMFYAACYNMPVGTTLTLTCQAAGPNPPIYANGTVVQYVNPSTLACLTTVPANWGPYPMQLIATAPSGQSLNSAQVFFQQYLMQDNLTADEIRPHMQTIPADVQKTLGLDGNSSALLVGECQIVFSGTDGAFGASLRRKGMFA